MASRCCRLTSRILAHGRRRRRDRRGPRGRRSSGPRSGERRHCHWRRRMYNILAMVLLALETVTRRGSIALVVDGACRAFEGDTDRTHGERLPGEVTDWLATHGLGLRRRGLLRGRVRTRLLYGDCASASPRFRASPWRAVGRSFRFPRSMRSPAAGWIGRSPTARRSSSCRAWTASAAMCSSPRSSEPPARASKTAASSARRRPRGRRKPRAPVRAGVRRIDRARG